jgi:hypothetical protein
MSCDFNNFTIVDFHKFLTEGVHNTSLDGVFSQLFIVDLKIVIVRRCREIFDDLVLQIYILWKLIIVEALHLFECHMKNLEVFLLLLRFILTDSFQNLESLKRFFKGIP